MLSKYYDYLEPICVDIAKRVAEWTGDICPEAQYLDRAARRILAYADSYNHTQPSIDALPIQPALTYLALLSEHLEAFLAGSMTGTQIVKQAGPETWEAYNTTNAIKSIYAEGVANAVSPRLAGKRIMELGGGVGATTVRLKHALPNADVFLFTDIQPRFLAAIKHKIPLAKLYTEQFDLNALPEMYGPFDVIYATNVLHCAHDIPGVLAWIIEHLSPDGCLIFGEGSPYSAVVSWPLDILFALFPGWWDVPINPNRPRPGFLTASQWYNFLREAGFTEIGMRLFLDRQRDFGGIYTAVKG